LFAAGLVPSQQAGPMLLLGRPSYRDVKCYVRFAATKDYGAHP